MKYIYSALILHKTKNVINEENIKNILIAANIEYDESQIKLTVEKLKDIDIEETINNPFPQTQETIEEEPEEEVVEEEEEKKSDMAEGLDKLFNF